MKAQSSQPSKFSCAMCADERWLRARACARSKFPAEAEAEPHHPLPPRRTSLLPEDPKLRFAIPHTLPSVARSRWLPTHASPASESAHDPAPLVASFLPRASAPPLPPAGRPATANAGRPVRWRRRAAVVLPPARIPIPPPPRTDSEAHLFPSAAAADVSSSCLCHPARHLGPPLPCLFKASDMLFSRRPLAAALHLSSLSPPLLLVFASASSSSAAAAASASGPRGCSAVRMETGAVESASTGAIWSTPSVEPRSISIGKQIFCNRSLNMRNITAVGFDMDYTLAQYKPETFEALAYHGTIEKLVKDLNYPEELLTWQFDWKYMVRGLVLDKKRGNILKMDRHKYVKVAYHGFREMSKEEKVAAYGSTLIRDSFDEPDYALVDTLFSLGEAYLFAQLVDLMDKNPGKVPSGTDYPLMYRDVRSAVDLCHRDGTLKRMVAKDPSRYINEDLAIVPMLQMIRNSGRSTFLVTNSLWDYTDVVMNYLCGPYISDVGSGNKHAWLDYFDVVITGSSKPSFFHDDNRAGLFEVEPDSGKLLNADLQIGSPRASQQQSKPFHKVYQGGNVGHLHRLLSVASSSQILYVGDHIYGDILRSKKVLGWRTMLVIPELEQEVILLSESKSTRKELRHLRMERDSIEDKIHRLEWSLKFENITENEKGRLLLEHDNLLKKQEYVRRLHQEAQRQHHQKFHKVWGQLMKTGYQNSRFAHQVERFACLYSSQVTNFGLYSPNKYYRPSEDYMPHEFDVLGL